MRRLVHLSDLHFGRIEQRLVDALIAQIHTVQPHLVAVSGDLTQRATVAQFKAARAFLDALPFPRLVVPGNHDVPVNLVARLRRPLGRYQQFVHEDVEPMFVDDEVVVLGLNSARWWTLGGAGFISRQQVQHAVERLRGLPPALVKIIVSHHPFDLPDHLAGNGLVGGARRAMAGLAQVEADLFLAGHLHVVHAGQMAERYQAEGHCALIMQAGTISNRLRGELPSFNVIELDRPHIGVSHHTWHPARGVFVPAGARAFRRGDRGWSEEAV